VPTTRNGYFFIGHTHNDYYCGLGGEPWIVNHLIQFIFTSLMGGDGGETNIVSWMCQILREVEMSTIVRHVFITVPLMLNMWPYKRKLNEKSQNMLVWFNKTILAQHFLHMMLRLVKGITNV
jgi:hypothetical protein